MYTDDVKIIQLDDINTFDDDHVSYNTMFLVKPYASTQTVCHRHVIEFIKCGLAEGKLIRPILVKKTSGLIRKYQRLDGFCRYWAYKELGHVAIPSVLGEKPGGQNRLDPFL